MSNNPVLIGFRLEAFLTRWLADHWHIFCPITLRKISFRRITAFSQKKVTFGQILQFFQDYFFLIPSKNLYLSGKNIFMK